MAEWPDNGVTDWNTKMKANIDVEHDSDGTHAIKWPLSINAGVDYTDTRIYTKYLTGNLDADSETTIAHGVTSGNTKILSISIACGNDEGGGSVVSYVVYDYRAADQAFVVFTIYYNDTNISVVGVGAYLQGNPYRIKIDYIL